MKRFDEPLGSVAVVGLPLSVANSPRTVCSKVVIAVMVAVGIYFLIVLDPRRQAFGATAYSAVTRYHS